MTSIYTSTKSSLTPSRREFLKTIALSPIAWYGLGCNRKTKTQNPLNVVIIFLDDSG
ncbi:MAG: hypothetical protein MUP70_03235 [Candidatus Aminicenantes bacterium]|nr:hypothetical protein [Candidatus Aminicenantes bacterium]